MNPWETWVRKWRAPNSRRQFRRLMEIFERTHLEPFEHTFGSKKITLPDGTRVKLLINKNGIVPFYRIKGEARQFGVGCKTYVESGLIDIIDPYTQDQGIWYCVDGDCNGILLGDAIYPDDFNALIEAGGGDGGGAGGGVG